MDLNNSIFQNIINIGKKLKDSKLEDELLIELTPDIHKVAQYLDTTNKQALVFILLFNLNFSVDKYKGIDFTDIAHYLTIDLIELLNYQKEVEELVSRRYLEKDYNRHNSKITLLNYHYSIPTRLIEPILMNEPILDIPIESELVIYDFVRKVSEIIEESESNTEGGAFLFSHIEYLESKHRELKMIDKMRNMGLNVDDRTLFYKICNDLLFDEGHTEINRTLKEIFSSASLRLRKAKEIMDQKHRLFELELIQLEEGNFFSEAEISLTEKGKVFFLEEDADLFLRNANAKSKNVIRPESITFKPLFYDEVLNHQLSFLQKSLEKSNFVNLQTRLEEKSLTKGVAAIFYGSPGTGKTETVYQLAKQTGRAILHVDISQSKSMWFGESEKKIKEIFTNYKKLCKTEEMNPILLFNEADAIFGKRKDGNTSNVVQTENAMQNIILEEMEKLDGILIATTNLNQNLDAAFERRFLFKVEFTKPTAEATQKIWQSKLPWMNDEDALTLASRYSFSGGEIDNVVRKATMEEVLSGNTTNFSDIVKFSEFEKFSRQNNVKIGF